MRTIKKPPLIPISYWWGRMVPSQDWRRKIEEWIPVYPLPDDKSLQHSNFTYFHLNSLLVKDLYYFWWYWYYSEFFSIFANSNEELLFWNWFMLFNFLFVCLNVLHCQILRYDIELFTAIPKYTLRLFLESCNL